MAKSWTENVNNPYKVNYFPQGGAHVTQILLFEDSNLVVYSMCLVKFQNVIHTTTCGDMMPFSSAQ